MSVSNYMGKLHSGIKSGEMCEALIHNMEETNFVIKFENGSTLGFSGDENVKYVDVVLSCEGTIMKVHITGGAKFTHWHLNDHLPK